jgi:membrane fusion protein, multidrug efflux system
MPVRARLLIGAFVLAVFTASACRNHAPKEAEAEPPTPVIAEPARIGDIRGVVSATGVVVTLPGADFVAVATQPARILDITKKAGDRVKSGELLVRFEFPALGAETTARAAAVKAADLRLQHAKLAQSRVQSLVERGAASRKEVDDAEREVNDAEAEVAGARASQRATEAIGQQTAIRAPFDGSVAERLHNPGDVIGNSPNDAILRVIDPRQVEVNATVPVKELTRFAVGATARTVAETRTTADLMRVLSRPEPVAGDTTVIVRLAFEQPTDLATGTQVAVEIDAEQHPSVTLVPAIAVLKDGPSAALFVAVGNQAIKRAVVIGLVDAEHVEIRSGVKAGEMVITQGQSNLRDGAAISMTQDAAAAGGK